jgi:hypothetical protein
MDIQMRKQLCEGWLSFIDARIAGCLNRLRGAYALGNVLTLCRAPHLLPRKQAPSMHGTPLLAALLCVHITSGRHERQLCNIMWSKPTDKQMREEPVMACTGGHTVARYCAHIRLQAHACVHHGVQVHGHWSCPPPRLMPRRGTDGRPQLATKTNIIPAFLDACGMPHREKMMCRCCAGCGGAQYWAWGS